MKAIIDEKLYDTEKAEKIYSFVRKVNGRQVIWNTNYCFIESHDISIYKTNKGIYFEHDEDAETIKILYESSVRDVIRRLNPDKYIELFGEVEEG